MQSDMAFEDLKQEPPINSRKDRIPGQTNCPSFEFLDLTRSEAPPAFMELLASPTTAAVSEGLIELEGRRGKMRIQWKGTAVVSGGLKGSQFRQFGGSQGESVSAFGHTKA